MQPTFCCSYLEEMAPPETLCSDCCSVELDILDTLFANRSVSAGQLHRCEFLCSNLSKTFLLKYIVKGYMILDSVNGHCNF